VHSVSFDDDSYEELCVFRGNDLLIVHHDVADLDWQEVAERSALDERRGLAIAQVVVLEDLIDELILYLADPVSIDAYQAGLDRLTIGPRLDRLEALLLNARHLDDKATEVLNAARRVVARRNELAHGTIYFRPVQPMQLGSLVDGIELEWVITSRRSRSFERITMAGLRRDVYDAIDCFSSMLQFAERLVESSSPPYNFGGGRYLGTP